MSPRRKKEDAAPKKAAPETQVEGLRAEVLEQGITDTLEQNYMPYAMSVIVSRAIPEIDGFKPSQRKLLYTMYKMNLLTGGRTKSANVVGQTMRLNPHGDSAIYDTMVRISRGYGALLHPFVDSKGNFGKVYSRDMAYAASRYTEVKLDAICRELFSDIDKDTVDFTDNYDSTMKEPTLLPTTFPNILVSANQGIAVGMASMISGFNLKEVCDATAAYMLDENCDLLAHMPAPDFATGGEMIYDPDAMREIYRTGRGSFKVRAKWRYVKKEHLIEVYELPYTTTVEAVMDKLADLIKSGKVRELGDVRDETDLKGLKLTMDLKRGTDPDKLMTKLFTLTPLMDSFSCNFNILIAGMPRVLGVRQVLEEWSAWRVECVRRRVFYDLTRKKQRLHLLRGLKKILLDIDRAIKIIRETESEAEVIPNLMIGFGIDQVQAEYVAEIRLRNINREYILKRVEETGQLEQEIGELEGILSDRHKIKKIISDELKNIAAKYGRDRKTTLTYEHEVETFVPAEQIEAYPVSLFLSREGYFKKITPASLRMSGEQKYKEGDGPSQEFEAQNRDEILFFTSAQQCYKCRLSEFDDTKASVLGDYLPTKLAMDEGETVCFACLPGAYAGHLLFLFANGRAARVPLSSYATVSNRRRLTSAYSGKARLVSAMHIEMDMEIAVFSSDTRVLVFSTALLAPKTTRGTQGVMAMSLKKNREVVRAEALEKSGIENVRRYRVRSLPAAGALLKPEDEGEVQLSL